MYKILKPETLIYISPCIKLQKCKKLQDNPVYSNMGPVFQTHNITYGELMDFHRKYYQRIYLLRHFEGNNNPFFNIGTQIPLAYIKLHFHGDDLNLKTKLLISIL